jgi:hypothetical protein
VKTLEKWEEGSFGPQLTILNTEKETVVVLMDVIKVENYKIYLTISRQSRVIIADDSLQ